MRVRVYSGTTYRYLCENTAGRASSICVLANGFRSGVVWCAEVCTILYECECVCVVSERVSRIRWGRQQSVGINIFMDRSANKQHAVQMYEYVIVGYDLKFRLEIYGL